MCQFEKGYLMVLKQNFPAELSTPENHNESNQGSFVWADGSSYIGEHSGGKPHGFGTYKWPDGDKYSGFWVNGKRHGVGFHSRENGFVYVGNFVNDLPEGDGSTVDIDGNSYSGNWNRGFQSGKGLLKDPTEGVLFFGEWENGLPLFHKNILD